MPRGMTINRILNDNLSIKNTHLKSMINYFVAHRLCKQQVNEVEFLCKCIQKLVPGSQVLEIGRKYGGGMLCMSKANPNIRVFSLDITDKHRVLTRKLAKLYGVRRKGFKMLTGDSREYEWVNGPIHFLFIDGWQIESDLVRFPPLVEKGGMVMINGYRPWKKYVDAWANKNKEFRFRKVVRDNILFSKK